MSVSAASAVKTVAFQLVAALERYEEDTHALTSGPFDVAAYRKVSEDIDLIERYSAAIPALSVAAVALLIAHTDLVHALWRIHYGQLPASDAELESREDEHRACVGNLRRRCLHYLRARQ